MRKGKIASQCCHASMAFLTKHLDWGSSGDGFVFHTTNYINTERCMEIKHWLENSFKKIVCYVNSEEELAELHQKALDAGLMSHLIEDNGATEFNGVKTKTFGSPVMIDGQAAPIRRGPPRLGEHNDEVFGGLR
jgi:PTH2 family peptidyl-tRNA hydrolase